MPSVALRRSTPQATVLKQRPRSTRHQGFRRWKSIFRRDRWTTETTALLFSATIVVIIAALLVRSDGQAIATWQAPITLNALLSLLVTVLYYPLIGVIANCVHQLRWNYFHTSHRLRDFETLYKASKGAVGALPVLFDRSSLWLPFRFTALLMLAVAAIGPFTQQILRFDTGLVLAAENAALPVSTALNTLPTRAGSVGGFMPYPALNNVLNAGIFAPNVTDFAVTPQCSSDNCTWADYTTFAVRSRVTNVTDRLVLADSDQYGAWLNNSAFNSSSYEAMRDRLETPISLLSISDSSNPDPTNSTWATWGIHSGMLSDAFGLSMGDGTVPRSAFGSDESFGNGAGSRTRFIQADAVIHRVQSSLDPWMLGSPQNTATYKYSKLLEAYIFYASVSLNATWTPTGWVNVSVVYHIANSWELIFDVVLQDFHSNLQNNTFSEMVIGDPVPYNGSGCVLPLPPDDAPFHPSCTLNYTLDGRVYGANSSILFTLAELARRKLNSIIKTGRLSYLDASHNFSDGLTSYSDSASETSLYLLQVITNQLANGTTLTVLPQSPGYSYSLTATGVSNFTIDDLAGNIARSLTYWMRTSQGQSAPGNMYKRVIIYKVEWQWMSVPASLILLIVCLLAYTVWETRRKDLPIYTDSALAILTHGLDDITRANLIDMRTTEELENASEDIRVRLNKENYMLEGVGLHSSKH